MPKSKKTSPSPVPSETKNYGVDIRMYFPGFGDCFLLTFHANDGSPRHVLIDCGVFVGYRGGAKRLNLIAQDIAKVTNSRLHIVAVTHEHADHISGFVDANFHDIQIDDLWLAWTEDPTDTVARQLKAGNKTHVEELTSAVNLMAQANHPSAEVLRGMLDFEVTSSGSDDNKSGLGYLKGKIGKQLRSSDYLRPGEPPLSIPGVDGVKVYVLGPPQNIAEIHNLERGDIYPKFAAFLEALKGRSAKVSSEDALSLQSCCPFDKRYGLIATEVKNDEFFSTKYGFSTDAAQGPEWRRIDEDWLDAASELALRIGEYTNNTSLVLALELPGLEPHKVLLFVGDAQVGNWLSWSDVHWDIETNGKKETITGEDLLRCTVFYKTGHHGSHNATLKTNGLELMDKSSLVSMIPVDEQWANKKAAKGFVFPAPKVLAGIEAQSQNRVLRSDKINTMPDILEKPDALDVSVWQDFLKHVKWDTNPDHLWIQYTVEG